MSAIVCKIIKPSPPSIEVQIPDSIGFNTMYLHLSIERAKKLVEALEVALEEAQKVKCPQCQQI